MFIGQIVADLAWGDAGKGVITDALTRLHQSTLNVRYSGGPQAMHNVVLSDGRHHCFSQFGAGSFGPNVRTHLSRFMLVEPYAMLNEAKTLASVGVPDICRRVTIDPDAVIVTPWHWLANRVREICRGDARHGSGGMGVGECRSQQLRGISLRVGDLGDVDLTRSILQTIKQDVLNSLPAVISAEAHDLHTELLQESIERNIEFYRDWSASISLTAVPLINSDVVFEGSQGVMLDEVHGTAPHTTWTNTTFDNAVTLCGEWGLRPSRVGVLRTYSTRHGAGPFLTHDPKYSFPDHNRDLSSWQGEFRQGPLDLVAARYAVRVSRPDVLALTHLDRIGTDWGYCDAYWGQDKPLTAVDFSSVENLAGCESIINYIRASDSSDSIVNFIENNLGIPIHYMTAGPTYDNFFTRMLQNVNSVGAI